MSSNLGSAQINPLTHTGRSDKPPSFKYLYIYILKLNGLVRIWQFGIKSNVGVLSQFCLRNP